MPRRARTVIVDGRQREAWFACRQYRGGSMSALKKMAEIPAGSWTKWVVVGFWVVVLVLAFPLSKKLSGAEKNDAKYWLPGAAESTKVLDVQERFQSPNIISGVVVYERASGLTAADRAKAAADARMFAGIPGVVSGQVMGPIPSADGRAMQTILQVNLGSQGWTGANKPVDAIQAGCGPGSAGASPPGPG
jgi:putative drug exporter of the RND superfamily